jgi:hypothetical protein
VEKSAVPTGVAVFPTDASVRRLIERENTVTHWSEFDRGGHFAAMEAPDLLVEDVAHVLRHASLIAMRCYQIGIRSGAKQL